MSTTSMLVKVQRESDGHISKALEILAASSSEEARCAARVIRKRRSWKPGTTHFRVEKSGFVLCYTPEAS